MSGRQAIQNGLTASRLRTRRNIPIFFRNQSLNSESWSRKVIRLFARSKKRRVGISFLIALPLLGTFNLNYRLR
jgi:hypothetical protein